MYILGLTGSIGMGKSTTADLFKQEGVPVHDSDATVHKLYKGKAAPKIEAAFPGTVKNGEVNRQKLGQYVIGKPDNMKKLEAIIHPLVAEDRGDFLIEAQKAGANLVLLDIPLLFETCSDNLCDYIVVVTTSADEQRRRVLSRDGMSEEKFEKILASQTPDAEKREKADFIIDTTNSIEEAHKQVIHIIDTIKTANQNA